VNNQGAYKNNYSGREGNNSAGILLYGELSQGCDGDRGRFDTDAEQGQMPTPGGGS